MKVLLEERDETMRAVIRPMLTGRDMSVIEASDPWQAAALTARHSPDVVLLSAADVYQSGSDLPRILSSLSRRARVLLVGAVEPGRLRPAPSQVDGYLPYPFDAPGLLAAITDVMTAVAQQTHAVGGVTS